MVFINLIAFVVCTIVALGCAVGGDQTGFTACALAGVVNGWIAYTHFTGL